MEIEYTTTAYTGKGDRQEVESISSFLYDSILQQEENFYSSGGKIRLEDQPQKVCEALGRLVERLLDRKADTLQLKRDEKT